MTSDGIDLEVGTDEARGALEHAVERWGGSIGDGDSQGSFVIPVRAGLRSGYVRLESRLTATRSGSRLVLDVLEEVLAIDRAAAFVLILGAAGGLVTVLWPLSESLMRLAPVGAVLAVVAWLLVASRLRSQGVDDFLETVAEIVDAGPEDADA